MGDFIELSTYAVDVYISTKAISRFLELGLGKLALVDPVKI